MVLAAVGTYVTSMHSMTSYVGQAVLVSDHFRSAVNATDSPKIYRCFRMYGSNWLIVTPSFILYAVTTGKIS